MFRAGPADFGRPGPHWSASLGGDAVKPCAGRPFPGRFLHASRRKTEVSSVRREFLPRDRAGSRFFTEPGSDRGLGTRAGISPVSPPSSDTRRDLSSFILRDKFASENAPPCRLPGDYEHRDTVVLTGRRLALNGAGACGTYPGVGIPDFPRRVPNTMRPGSLVGPGSRILLFRFPAGG